MRKKEKCNFKLGEKLDKIILYSERDDIVISNDIKVGPNKSEKKNHVFSYLGRLYKAT